MNITQIKSVTTDEGTHLIIECIVETNDADNADLTIRIPFHGFAQFLRLKYNLWDPDAYAAAKNEKRTNYNEDLIEWLHETLTFPVEKV